MTDVERAATDREFLQQQAYADSRKLRARVSIYAYRDQPYDFTTWVLGLVDWPEAARVLDVGCGPGTYLAMLRERDPRIRAVGLDLSMGMAAEASRHAPTLNGDAARLPVPDGVVDRVLAPHMLYHCPDIPAAIEELRRVLRPGGSLIAVTNEADHLHELWDVYAAVTGERPALFVNRFDMTTGEAPLRAVFEDVRLERTGGTLLVPDDQPVIDYMASTVHFATRENDNMLEEIRGRVRRVIDAEGVFRIHTGAGAFVCR